MSGGGPYTLHCRVPTVLVTGATGLVGSHVTRLLVERGDQRARHRPRPLARSTTSRGLDVERVTCDVLDRRAVRRALRGVERVFHVAGHDVAARAARAALPHQRRRARGPCSRRRCARASSASCTRRRSRRSARRRAGSTADERQPFTAGGARRPVRARQARGRGRGAAHRRGRAAGRHRQPGHVFGAGDLYRSSTELVLRFLRRQIPAYVDGALNIVDAEDVARGHLLADERGEPGERYILGNRNFTLDRLFADLGRLSRRRAAGAQAAAAGGARAGARRPRRCPASRRSPQVEVRAASQWWAYRSTKAKRELGWKPSHHEDTLERTIAWYRERGTRGLARPGTGQPFGAARGRLRGAPGRRRRRPAHP